MLISPETSEGAADMVTVDVEDGITEEEFTEPMVDVNYDPPNPIGIFVGICCNILYIYVCCKIKTAISEDDEKKLENQRRFWLYAVLGCIAI